jgi:hypothetical protein
MMGWVVVGMYLSWDLSIFPGGYIWSGEVVVCCVWA